MVAHAHGSSLRIDELNSVSCGGKRGVSDTFASALWILDTLFQFVHAGIDGVNIHTFAHAIYEPFAFSRAGGRWHADVKPLYYGLLAFARAAPVGSRLLPTFISPQPRLRVWATRSPDGTVSLLLIDEGRRGLTVAALPPGPVQGASAQTLQAPRLGAKADVTLGGQSVAPETTTGQLSGPLTSAALPAAIHGRYLIRVAPASATLVTFATRPADLTVSGGY